MGALRIKSPRELQALKENKQIGNRAASLIEKELAKVQSKAKTLGSTQPGRKILPNSPHTNVSPFCPVPPIEPADRLYQALVQRWGRYYSGGEVVWELQPFDDSGYRLDAALVNYRIGLEMDGWQFHGKTLSGFKKDRKKQLLFCRRGWLLFRVSNEQVREELEDIIQAVEEAMSFQPYRRVKLRSLPKGWSQIRHDQ